VIFVDGERSPWDFILPRTMTPRPVRLLVAENRFHIPPDRFTLLHHGQELPDLPLSYVDPDAARYAIDVAFLSPVTPVSFVDSNTSSIGMFLPEVITVGEAVGEWQHLRR
jgi:hypothetical protein